MTWYCEKCKKIHQDNELCENYRILLKENPDYLKGVMDFTVVAAKERLVSTQAINGAAKVVNELTGTRLTYEGTKQLARDVQVFKRLDTEAFVKMGTFRTPEQAAQYLENATNGQMTSLLNKITGSSQEVDWLLSKNGDIKSLVEKSELLNKNAVAIDGEVFNRFNGNTLERVTIKASRTKTGIHSNNQKIIEALKRTDGHALNPTDTVYAVKGTKADLLHTLDREIRHAREIGDVEMEKKMIEARKGLKIVEKNTPEEVSKSNERLLEKIKGGEAVTEITGQQVAKKALQGAAIGAAVEVTISSVVSYIKYKNGEITKEDAFRDIGESAVKGALSGAAAGAITLFLPAGPVGFVAGVGIGIYMDAVLTNTLDEVFGKGFYLEVLNASGYIAGTTQNIESYMKEFAYNIKYSDTMLKQAKEKSRKAEQNIQEIERMNQETYRMLEGI